MPISYACAFSHAPGIPAWSEAAPAAQRGNLHAGIEVLRRRLDDADLDALILFTSEHWTNFFLDHVSPFCVGRSESYEGPVEPWPSWRRRAYRDIPPWRGNCWPNAMRTMSSRVSPARCNSTTAP